MYPDSPFAVPKGSFGSPVPVPDFDPDQYPTIAISINCQWLAYIRGALQQLLLQTTWKTDDPAVLALAQQRAFDLIAMFVECGSGVPYACHYDFFSSDEGWVNDPVPVFSPHDSGVYVGGSGWEGTDCNYIAGIIIKGIQIRKTFAATTLTHIEFTYDLFKGANTSYTGDGQQIQLWLAGVLQTYVSIPANTDPDGLDKVLAWDGAVVADKIVLVCNCDSEMGFTAGSCTITNAQIMGTGPHPC
jgi:hypothetical protein